MHKRVFTSAGLPTHHDRLLIVRTTAAADLTAAARVANVKLTAETHIEALAYFRRAGLIRKATVIERPGKQAKGTMAKARPREAATTVVELERDADATELQRALAHDPAIQFAARIPVRYLLAARARARPPAASSMWNLKKVEWPEARAVKGFKDARAIDVAVLDTGIDIAHPDLKAQVKAYTHDHPDLTTASGPQDLVGHGTHVAGTIAASIDNELGVNGICACRLHAFKIFADEATFLSWDEGFAYVVDPVMYLRALADCVDDGIRVINLSIGGPGEPDPQEQALFDELAKAGVTVVAAMGNEREWGSPTSYPAAIPGVIAVGATSLDDTVADFSNRGRHIALCAPGKAIWSTLPTYAGQFGFEAVEGPGGDPKEGKADKRETSYDAWDGTSMATPHVAAAAALLLAKNGKLKPAEVKKALQGTADRVKGMGGKSFHQDYGAGRLNLRKLLA